MIFCEAYAYKALTYLFCQLIVQLSPDLYG